MDPWRLVNLSNDRITFKHDGYYLISVAGGWENNAVGERHLRVLLSLANGFPQRTVLLDVRPAAFTANIAVCSDVQPFGAGQYITAQVYQSSGGPLLANGFFISILRVARPRTVTPLTS